MWNFWLNVIKLAFYLEKNFSGQKKENVLFPTCTEAGPYMKMEASEEFTENLV